MELYIALAAGLFGLLVGSFLNVVIYRLPVSMMNTWRSDCKEFLTDDSGIKFDPEPEAKPFNVAFPRSHCPSCKELIPAWCNIPIASYLLLKGRCLRCKTKISIRYPLIELLTGLVSAFAVFTFGLSVESIAVLFFSWALISLTFIDIDHKLLPDQITLPLLWVGLLVNAQGMFTDIHSALYGAAAGYLCLWSIYWLFKLITGKEGMGYGDFKLLAALGAWLGWQHLPSIIILSSCVGAIIGIANILISGQDKDKQIPFGPYLAIAGWIAFFWGESLLNSYLQFITPTL